MEKKMNFNRSEYLNLEICFEEKQSSTIYLVTLGVMGSVALYFLTSLIVSLKRSPTVGSHPENKSCCNLQYTTILRTLLLVVILSISVRLALDITQQGLGESGYRYFAPFYVSKAVLSTIINACVYAFLWLRQWLLYAQPILREVKTTTFKVFNIALLVLVTSLVGVGPALELRYVSLELSEEGCMYARAQNWGIATAIYTAFAVTYELILLGFFIYPMKRARSVRSKPEKYDVLPIVKRSLVSALVCFFNEILFTVIHNVIERPVMLHSVTPDIKYLVYYVCLVCSYNDWMQKFCLPCAVKVHPGGHGSRGETVTKCSTDLDVKTKGEGD